MRQATGTTSGIAFYQSRVFSDQLLFQFVNSEGGAFAVSIEHNGLHFAINLSQAKTAAQFVGQKFGALCINSDIHSCFLGYVVNQNSLQLLLRCGQLGPVFSFCLGVLLLPRLIERGYIAGLAGSFLGGNPRQLVSFLLLGLGRLSFAQQLFVVRL